MSVTVKQMSHNNVWWNNCWNEACFSCCRKADNELLADVTLSGSLLQPAATGKARPPTVDSLNGGIRRRFDPTEHTGQHTTP